MSNIVIPKAYRELFEPKRIKVYYGGRGGGKSWAIADSLIVKGMEKPLRVLCARELQISIADSVHKLLSDQIRKYELEWFYEITQTSIRGRNGTEFMFKGMKHNATEIKSTEGIDIAWVEEAEKVSDNSWELLIPTIRKEGSEIWVSFNPKNPTDPTYRRFVEQQREDSIVRKVSWRDNPFFPEVLAREKDELKKNDPLAYAHIWEGDFDTRFFGGVYSKQVAEAQEAGRIKAGLYDKSLPVNTAWDLGYDDSTAIWFWQRAGREIRLVDYYESANEGVEHYCDVLKAKSYTYDKHFVPHDARNKLMAAGGRSIVEQAYAKGIKMFALPPASQQNLIEATRQMIADCWFDPICKQGLECLRQYQFEYDEDRKTYKSTPRHDWASHGADAFEIIAQVRNTKLDEVKPSAPRFLHETTADEVFWPKTSDTYKDERI